MRAWSWSAVRLRRRSSASRRFFSSRESPCPWAGASGGRVPGPTGAGAASPPLVAFAGPGAGLTRAPGVSGRLALFRLSYARAQQLAPLLDRILTPAGRVSYDARTNTLIVAY